jgi:hypothetical protein
VRTGAAGLDHGANMHALVLTEVVEAGGCGDLDAAVRDRLVPSLRVAVGFCGALHLVSRSEGQALLVLLWETEEQALDAASLPEIVALGPASRRPGNRTSVWEVTQRA